jgi:hypothetical protein
MCVCVLQCVSVCILCVFVCVLCVCAACSISVCNLCVCVRVGGGEESRRATQTSESLGERTGVRASGAVQVTPRVREGRGEQGRGTKEGLGGVITQTQTHTHTLTHTHTHTRPIALDAGAHRNAVAAEVALANGVLRVRLEWRRGRVVEEHGAPHRLEWRFKLCACTHATTPCNPASTHARTTPQPYNRTHNRTHTRTAARTKEMRAFTEAAQGKRFRVRGLGFRRGAHLLSASTWHGYWQRR